MGRAFHDPGSAGASGLAPRPARTVSNAYRRIERMFATDECVILDGAMATELGRVVPPPESDYSEALWGTWALLHAPDAIFEISRQYATLGCDVISTNTWGLTDTVGLEQSQTSSITEPVHWIDVARRGIQLGREAIELAGRDGEVALAFSINGDIDSEQKRQRIELLTRVFEDEPPDLVLLETMTLIRDGLTMDAIAMLIETGVPVWLSFRRCRHGVCGVFGQHWGGPEGDDFGRVARRLEEMGASALLINCLPPDHVGGMLPWLADFTDLPLGVYPNLGYYTSVGWTFDERVKADDYARFALQWREEGASIIGGCCGVRPEHIRAARTALAGSRRGRGKAGTVDRLELLPTESAAEDLAGSPWEEEGRALYPLPMPEIVCEPGVFVPPQGSFLGWKHLFLHDVGQGRRCLDLGCGAGILTVQLALNGAEHVHAIDLDRRAVANTLANAFRNGVAERVTGEAVDLYPWVPAERYDVVVASLYQMPVDPFEQRNSHRPVDFWGRNLLDHVLTHLEDMLADDGVAYVMQLSILSQKQTARLVEDRGYVCRVADFTFFELQESFRERLDHIRRVEQLSDAYHLTFGDTDAMVAYLLEIRRAPA